MSPYLNVNQHLDQQEEQGAELTLLQARFHNGQQLYHPINDSNMTYSETKERTCISESSKYKQITNNTNHKTKASKIFHCCS